MLIVLIVVFSLVVLVPAYLASRAAKNQTEVRTIAQKAPSLAYADTLEGHDFERWCASLLRSSGFTNVVVTKGSGDQGVDITAQKNDVRYAIQCKRYSKNLGNKPVQEVVAGKNIYRCNVGVVMTNQYFTAGARELAKANNVLLWDRDRLQAMINAIQNHENEKAQAELKARKHAEQAERRRKRAELHAQWRATLAEKWGERAESFAIKNESQSETSDRSLEKTIPAEAPLVLSNSSRSVTHTEEKRDIITEPHNAAYIESTEKHTEQERSSYKEQLSEDARNAWPVELEDAPTSFVAVLKNILLYILSLACMLLSVISFATAQRTPAIASWGVIFLLLAAVLFPPLTKRAKRNPALEIYCRAKPLIVVFLIILIFLAPILLG